LSSVAEPLGVESPVLEKGAEVEVATEFGVLSVFLGEGDLEVVTGDRFVEGEGHHFPFEAHVRGVEIDLKRKWLRANLPPSLAPQGFPLLGWHHLIDATSANR